MFFNVVDHTEAITWPFIRLINACQCLGARIKHFFFAVGKQHTYPKYPSLFDAHALRLSFRRYLFQNTFGNI